MFILVNDRTVTVVTFVEIVRREAVNTVLRCPTYKNITRT